MTLSAKQHRRHADQNLLESLEARCLLSSFVYSDLQGTVMQPEPVQFGAEYVLARREFKSFTVVGDIDQDGADDVLAVNGNYVELLSGKSAAVMRIYSARAAAALGDTDGDGVPDYAIDRDVYSGKTGGLRYSLPKTGESVTSAGDIDHDDRSDILVNGTSQGKVYEYSGFDGTLIRTIDGIASSLVKGGFDLNADGVPDLITSTVWRLTAYSGVDGAQLFAFDHPNVGPSPYVYVDAGADFNRDGTADLLVTINEFIGGQEKEHARAYSGADGSQLYELVGDIAGPAGIIDDVNGDGVMDVASSVRQGTPTGLHQGVSLRSGDDGHAIAFLPSTGPAMLVQTGYYRSEPMYLSGPFTPADLNGDGLREVIGRSQFYIPGYSDPEYATHYVAFDGSTLGNPVFDGAGSDREGSLTAWGHLGTTPFVYNRGRATLITDLGFTPSDQILVFTAYSDEVLMVIAPGGDGSKPIAWFAGADLAGGRTYAVNDAARTGGPAGSYILDGVVDADGGQILVQMTRDGLTPSTWVFERTPGGGAADPGQLVYRFDGRPVAIYAQRIAGLSNDHPADGLLWDFADPIPIPGLRPVGLYLGQDGTATPPIVVVGLAQRGSDLFQRPYTYDSSIGEFAALPVIEGGTDWNPVAVNSVGDVAGTFRRSSGDSSVFLTRHVYLGDPTVQTFDVLAEPLIGGPTWLAGAGPAVIGLGRSTGGTGPYEIYIRYDDPSVAEGRSAVLSTLSGPGPFYSPADAAFALSQDGSALVTRNVAGELLVYIRRERDGGGESWSPQDMAFSPGGSAGPPTYDTPHVGPIVTWTVPGYVNPFIALATAEGLILLEPVLESLAGSGQPAERYHIRNLTAAIPSSEPIDRSLITILPLNNLRLIAGLAVDGDLVMYGLNAPFDRAAGVESSWSYANLYDQVLRPVGATEPEFRTSFSGDLVGYVTAWGGLNFAGIDYKTGDLVAFWTSPGLAGWQLSSLTDALPEPPKHTFYLNHLSVYLTAWGGINLVGGRGLAVYWWAPGMGGIWKLDVLSDIVTDGPILKPETVTSYVTPWGGLNVAGLDDSGRIWVYWWTPTTEWTAQTIDAALSDADRDVPRTGRLRSAVSATGNIDIFARTPVGDSIRYAWGPAEPWKLHFLSLVD